MKLVHYMPRIVASEGGTPRAVMDMCALLAARDNHLTLLLQDGPDIPEPWRTDTPGLPRVLELGSGSRPLARLGDDQLERADALLADADALHLHCMWQPEHAQLARRARARDIPVVLTPHGHLDNWPMSQHALKKRLFLLAFGRAIFANTSAIHCTAEAERDQTAPRVRGVPVHVVPLPFDVSPFQTLPGEHGATEALDLPARPAPVVLFISRLHEKKRPDIALRAFARAAPDDAVLVLAGTGTPRATAELEALARSLAIADRTRFAGHVSGDLKVSLYQRADAMLLPTSQENFGLVIPEALACRTPVVTTRGVDIWPTIQREAGAAIVEQSVGAFSDALAALLDNPDHRESLGERGRSWVLEHLDGRKTAQRLESLYRLLRDPAPIPTERHAP